MNIDTDTARIVARLAEIQTKVADLNTEAEHLKSELRDLPAGDHDIDGRPALRIIPNRRFDPDKGLQLVPEALRSECYTTVVDAKKVKGYLPPAVADTAMIEVGKPKVVLV